MHKALTQNATQRGGKQVIGGLATGRTTGLDWRKRISNHVAYGLLVYTGLHIFVTMTALKTSHGSILPYFSLIILVGAIIPVCRGFEKRWEPLSDEEAGDPAFAGAFRRDIGLIWLGALGLPLALTGIFKGILALV